MAYSGAWLTLSQQPVEVPLVPGLDPEHLRPTANPNLAPGERESWQSSAPAPDLPVALMPGEALPLVTGGGPVDRVPDTHGYGPGAGHGLTDIESLDRRAPYNLTDDGSYAARKWTHMVDRDMQPHVAVIPDMVGDGESPRTLDNRRSGYGRPNDPGARLGKRIKRWVDGKIDFHRWEVSRRPTRPRYARPQVVQAMTDGGPSVPPWPSSVGYNPSSQDRFNVPVVRRSPEMWSQPMATDGAAQTLASAGAHFGLTQWGL